MSSYFIVKPPVVVTPTPTYDYGSVYSNIYTALSNIDADTTPMAATLALIATSLATLATNSTTLATNSTTLASDSTVMKNLAEGSGIHFIGPYDYIGLIGVYKSLIEEGSILKPATVQKSATKVATSKITEYLNAISSLPKQF